jgi:uncharacterized membrane protein
MRSIPKLLLVFAALSIGVAGQTLTTFAVNPKGGASPTGINDNGDVVGAYGCGQPEEPCGFLRYGSTGTVKHLGAKVVPWAVNNSDEIVGTYRISAFYWPFGGTKVQFLRGDHPSAIAVNTAGYLVGSYTINYGLKDEAGIAYLMDPKGNLTTLLAPPDGAAEAFGINNLNQVVGSWSPTLNLSTASGFLYSDGTINTSFNVPNAVATWPYAINDNGEVVGSWQDSVGFVHGFYWTQQAGFTSFDAPKTTHTFPLAINNAGVIVGEFATKKQTADGAFMLDAAGTLTVISIPHAKSAFAVGINTHGLIVGTYFTESEQRGFLYQP